MAWTPIHEAAMERAMKVQEVMLQAMAKKITWWQAAEILGISDRHMRRWRERYEESGYNGLFDRRRGRAVAPKRVPVAVVEQVLGLYREKLFRSERAAFSREAQVGASDRAELQLGERHSARSGAGGARDASAECIASGDRGGRCRGCCCTSTAAGTVVSETSAGTI